MTNKQLNEKELEEINGGDGYQECIALLPSVPQKHIGMYEAKEYIGQMVYVLDDNHSSSWVLGELKNSVEESYHCYTTIMHYVYVDRMSSLSTLRDAYNSPSGLGMHKYSGDVVTLYLK